MLSLRSVGRAIAACVEVTICSFVKIWIHRVILLSLGRHFRIVRLASAFSASVRGQIIEFCRIKPCSWSSSLTLPVRACLRCGSAATLRSEESFFDGGVVKNVVKIYNWVESSHKACSQQIFDVNWSVVKHFVCRITTVLTTDMGATMTV